MGQIKGVLLDIDGTLVDSNEAHARSWADALAEQGMDVPLEKIVPLIGMGGDKLLPQVTGITEDSAQGKALTERRKQIFLERYVPHLQPTPGAHELLRQLKQRGYQLVVATSAKKDELSHLLKVCGAEGLIEQKTTADDADQSKPDPDIVEAALERIELPADCTVMLGDTPYDIAAASKAGVGVIALRSGGWKDRDLAGALAVYEDPADLLAHLDQSPLVNGRS